MKRAILFSALLACAPTLAAAQGPTAQERAQALSEDAFQLYEKGDYAKAIAEYLEAYQLAPTAEVLYNIAKIYDKKLNDARMAVEYYRRYSASPDPRPDLVAKAVARVAVLSAALEQTPNGTGTRGPAAPSAAPSTPPPETPRAKESGGLGLPLTVSIATAATGVAVGVGFGIAAVVQKGSFTSECNADKSCPETSRSSHDTMQALGTVSTVGFVVGAVGIAASAVFLFVFPNKERSTLNAESRKKSGEHVGVIPWIGNNQAGVAGTF